MLNSRVIEKLESVVGKEYVIKDLNELIVFDSNRLSVDSHILTA